MEAVWNERKEAVERVEKRIVRGERLNRVGGGGGIMSGLVRVEGMERPEFINERGRETGRMRWERRWKV